MSQQTAVEWLFDTLAEKGYFKKLPVTEFKQAKAMEKEQIMKTARQCHFEGVRQSAKNSEEYLQYGEQYYNETYNK